MPGRLDLMEASLPRRCASCRRPGGTRIAAVVFGLAHVANPPIPNRRYALLARLAALAYGHVYERTRSISASALTHALVDWVWVALLAGARVP